jgi:Ser/Thr protein kinase RdoA (MazF antagonist)
MLTSENASLISDRFGLGRDAVMDGPVARGELGQVWRLDSTHGTFAVKEWFQDFPSNELEEGAAFQEAAAMAGVSCPSVRRRRDGSLLLELGGTTTAVYGWVDVRERSTGIDAAAVGSLVAALHRVAFEGHVPADPWYSEPVGRDQWDELIAQLRARRAPFAERLAEYRDELVALEELIAPPSSLRTCHRDLWADNLRATAGGDLCLIDWDNAGLADPTGELALVLFEFCRGAGGRARELSDAYEGGGGPGRVRNRSDFSMPIAQLSHIGERACRLWLEAETEVGRARAASLADEFTGDVLSMDIIAELLDAIHAN